MIVFILVVLLLFFSQLLEFDKLNKYWAILFTIVCFLIFTINISYTADWKNYRFLFDNTDIDSKDYFIKFISLKFSEYGLEYKRVYQFHIFFIAILYTSFTSKFLRNPLLVVLCFLLVCFVPLTNQIRYFLAFILYLFSIYYFYKKEYKKFIIFLCLTLLNHIAILPLYLILFFFRKEFKLKYYVFLSLIIYIVMFSITNISFSNKFDAFNFYLKDDMRSSFLGGLLKIFPSFLTLSLIYFLSKRRKFIDGDAVFLYKTSFFPIIFLPTATMIQIIGDRYVFVFSIVWFIFLMSIIRNKTKYLFLWKLAIVSYTMFLWSLFYYLPEILLGYSYLLEEFITTFNSQF